MILVKFEIIKALEPKSLKKPKNNKNATKGVVILSSFLVLENSAKTKGVSTKIAPSFAKNVATNNPSPIIRAKNLSVPIL